MGFSSLPGLRCLQLFFKHTAYKKSIYDQYQPIDADNNNFEPIHAINAVND